MSFQKFSGGDTPAGGDLLPQPGLPLLAPGHVHPAPGQNRARGASAPVLGPNLGSPQIFSRGCAPGCKC